MSEPAASRYADVRMQPVFIVGCGHSGTTLLARILDHHPDMAAVREETALWFRRSSLQRLQEIAAEHPGKRLVEKTPRHLYRIGKILDTVPGARIVAMMRDGRDVVRSFEDSGENALRACRRWVCDARFLAEWLDNPKVYLLRYEDLVRNTRAYLEHLLSWLGARQVDLRDYWKTPVDWMGVGIPGDRPEPSDEKRYRNWQINQPIGYERRTGLWRGSGYPSQLDPMLEKYGYGN